VALDRVTIHGYRGARDVVLEPGAVCVLVGESSSGKSTVLSAIWTLLEAAAPMPTAADVSHGYSRVHVEATISDRTLFLDARPPGTLNLNREGAPPTLFFPANLRPALGDDRSEDGGLALVRTISELVEKRVRGLVILIEEPELYLSPPAQRHLHRQLRALAARGRNQVLYSTHSPVFLGVDRIEELVLVRHDRRTGTTLLQPQALDGAKAFRVFAELDSERAEVFLSRAVMLVEGRTEKLVLPFVFRALGYDADQEAIAIIDCAGKGNIPLFAEICNTCNIPYVVVHDRDAPRGVQPSEAEQISNDAILRIAGKRRTIPLVPDFEGVTGLKARRGKPAAAYKRFSGRNAEVPPPLRQAVQRVVAAARHAPRTSRGA
jgi:predicted ATP-dependent endonuclease of OLD family